LPPLVTRPPDVPAEASIPPHTIGPPAHSFEIHVQEPPAQPVPLVPVLPVPENATQSQIAAAQPNLAVRKLFGSAFSLRDAIIVREILGPPRGLREPELL